MTTSVNEGHKLGSVEHPWDDILTPREGSARLGVVPVAHRLAR